MTTIDLGRGARSRLRVAEAKAWARIERDDEDGLIAALIRAAREAIEAMAGLVLVAAQLSAGARSGARRRLGRGRRAGRWGRSTGVTAYTRTACPCSFDAGGVAIERSLGLEAFRLSPAARGRSGERHRRWSSRRASRPARCPENLLLALKTIVAASYEMRAAVEPGMQPAVMPALASALIAPYRRVRI